MNKSFKVLLIGFAIFLMGFIVYKIELNGFTHQSFLPSIFLEEQEIVTYTISSDKVFRITNEGTNKNLNLYIDNYLEDEVRIIINHVDFSSVEHTRNVLASGDKELIALDFENSKEIYMKDIANIFQLGVMSFRDKIPLDNNVW